MKKTTTTINAKQIAIAVAAVCASLSMPAIANENKAMLDLMLKKGVITQKDYNDFMEANKEADENKAFKDSRIDKDVSKSITFIQKRAADGAVKPSGFGWVSGDGNNEINLTGRLHYDARVFDDAWGLTQDRDSGSMADRFTIRRARIGVNGVFNKDFNYELVTNLTGATTNTGATNSTAVIDTSWINYTIKPEMQVRVGRMKQPMSNETLQSSNNIDFMERSYLDQIAPGKQNGLMLHGESGSMVYALSAFQYGYDQVANSTKPSFGARVSNDFAKAFGSDDSVFHLGLSALSADIAVVPTSSSQGAGTYNTKGAVLAFRDENLGLSNVYRNRIYGTCVGIKPDGGGDTACSGTGGYSLPAASAATTNRIIGAFEAAYATGPYKLQYEYANASISAKSQANRSSSAFDTFYQSSVNGSAIVQYVSLMWNITGESWKDSYKSGLFGSVKPKSNFNIKDGTGTGAWQLGFRMSKYDASDFGASTTGAYADESDSANGGRYQCNGNYLTGGSPGAGTQPCYQLGGSPTATTYTLGLNWILNPNARIMFNYSRTSFGNAFYPVDNGTGGTAGSPTKSADSSQVFSARAQFNF